MSESENSKIEALMPEVREFVRDKLKEDYNPQELTFALSFIATELGLHCTDNSTRVFPVMLRAIAHAVDAQSVDSDDIKESTAVEADKMLPADTVLH